MKTQDIVGLLGTAAALLVAAALTVTYRLWSFLGNSTVSWFCAALAVALLLVVLTAVLSGCDPGAIPRTRLLVVLVGSSLAVGVGMLVDAASYPTPGDCLASIGEWIGFTIILAVLFWLPRIRAK